MPFKQLVGNDGFVPDLASESVQKIAECPAGIRGVVAPCERLLCQRLQPAMTVVISGAING